METTKLARWGALAAVALLLASAVPAAAYPGTVDRFSDGALDSTVEFLSPPATAFVGTVRLPSNGTVTGGSILVAPGSSTTSLSFTENGSSGFSAGAPSGGLDVSGSGLSLGIRGGVATFNGAALDAGTFSGTAKSGGAVVLTGGSGSYDTPLIAWDGASYGRLIAKVDNTKLGTVQFSIVSAAGAIIQSSVATGAVISVDGSTYPSIRVRADMSAPSLSASPEIIELGVGHAIVGAPLTGAGTHTLSGLGVVGSHLALDTSRTNFSSLSASPVVDRVPGSWYGLQLGVGSAVVVGTDIWLYVAGLADAGAPLVIGRAVSADGGDTWTVDASPLLEPTPSAWDSNGVFAPSVMWDGATGWQMWYTGYGALGNDHLSIGYATSSDGITWTKYASAPVLAPEASSWDSQSVTLGGVVKVGPTYFLYFAARDTMAYNKKLGVATSPDGISWARFAGNPIISPATAWYTDSEPYSGNVYYRDGMFYFYWVSSSLNPPGHPGYATCLSTSTDGFNFTLDPTNPIIWYGQHSWDYNGVEQLTETYNPFTGEPVWLYDAAVFATQTGDIGRAYPSLGASGSFTGVWDLSGDMPRSITAVDVGGTVPGGTAVAVSLSSSSSASSFPGDESVAFGGDSTITTQPDNFLRLSLAASTSTLSDTPTVDSMVVSYDRYMTSGAFLSQATLAPYFIAGANVTMGAAVPAGTSVGLQISNDGGSTWETAASGAAHTFASSGKSFRYKLDLAGLSDAAPSVSEIRITLALAVNPHDLVLETAGGLRVASFAGELTTPSRIPLDASVLNALVAPSAGSVPAVSVDVNLYATSSSPGLARFSGLSIDLSLPDELDAAFVPNLSHVDVAEGRTFLFSILASTTPGVALHYSWSVDGTVLPWVESNFTFGPQLPGNFTVRGVVTNGQFSDEFSWAVTVVPKAVKPASKLLVAFWPSTDVVVHVNDTVLFLANVTAPADPPVTYQWRIVGGIAGYADTGNFTVVPSAAGSYSVWVTVFNAAGAASYLWNLTVIPVDAPKSGPSTHVVDESTGDPFGLALLLVAAVAGAAFVATYVGGWRRSKQR